jgi:hypothetical protein
MSIFKLFFGGSFFGIAVTTVAGLFPFWLAVLVTGVGLGMIVRVLRRNGRDDLVKFRWWVLILTASLIASPIFLLGATLSASGKYGVDNSSQNSFEVEKDLLILAGWVLLGIPHRAFRIRLDPDGDGYAQRVLLRLLATIAATLTGTAIFLLHFGNGPLKGVGWRALLVGTFFTVALAAPIYMALAKRCWQLGIQSLSPKLMIKYWNEALTELNKALYRQAKSGRVPLSCSAGAEFKVSQDEAGPPPVSRRRTGSEKASSVPAGPKAARRRRKKSAAKVRRHR